MLFLEMLELRGDGSLASRYFDWLILIEDSLALVSLDRICWGGGSVPMSTLAKVCTYIWQETFGARYGI